MFPGISKIKRHQQKEMGRQTSVKRSSPKSRKIKNLTGIYLKDEFRMYLFSI